MLLMLDTTKVHIGKAIAEELLRSGENADGFELIDTTGMHISHCVGCNVAIYLLMRSLSSFPTVMITKNVSRCC